MISVLNISANSKEILVFPTAVGPKIEISIVIFKILSYLITNDRRLQEPP